MLSGIALFLIGICLFFRVDRIPGDLGDARFNMYVLEHGYRWFMHRDSSFWSAPFFYPAPNVITYSDNHLGSFLFYSVFRIFGASRETAFQLWAVTIFSLNYFVTRFVLRRQRLHAISAAAAAYIFTFGLAMTAQIGHIQLAPRFMIPIAFWMTSRFLETGLPMYLHSLLAACAFQIYLGIYNGYFLLLCLIPFCLALFLIRRQWNAVRSFIEHSGRSLILRRLVEYAASFVLFVLILLPLAIPYYQTQQLLGHRTWEEVMTMLPRWQSYFYGPDSLAWGSISQGFGANLPMRNEHKLFPGVLPYLAIIGFLYFSLRKRINPAQSQVSFAMVSALAVLVAATSYGLSMYHFIWAFVPGAGGIRAVSRITLVLLYPAVFIFAVAATALLESPMRTGESRRFGFLGLGLLVLTVIDQAATGLSVGKRECKRRITNMEAAMLKARGKRVDLNVFWVNQNDPDPSFVKNLDTMLAGQALGINVVNGYSGLLPNGYPVGLAFLEGDCCTYLRIWAAMHPGMITSKSLVQIGPNCQWSDNEYMPVPVRGFRAIEVGPPVHLWATDPVAELLAETINQPGERVLSFDLATLRARTVRITGPGKHTQKIHLVPGSPQHVNIRIMPANTNALIKLQTDKEGVELPGANRPLFFNLQNPDLRLE